MSSVKRSFIVSDPSEVHTDASFARRDAEMFLPNEPRTRWLATPENVACSARTDARITQREREQSGKSTL